MISSDTMWKIRLPLCNRRPERAPKIFGYTFILCWRCTMLALGSFISYLFHKYFYFHVKFILIPLLMLPMILDGSLQYFFKKESTNIRRAITGFAFGIGYYFWGLILFSNFL